MDTPTTKTTVYWTLVVLILAAMMNPVLADSCALHSLRAGQGAAVSNVDTFGCRTPFCDGRYTGYHIILHGNTDWRSQKVEVNLQKACNRSSVQYENTVLVLVSGSPVNWVLTGFTPGIVFLVGDGKILQDSDEGQFQQYNIDVGNIHQYLKKLPTGGILKAIYNKIDQNYDASDSPWYFNEDPASVNYALKATSWTLTVGKECCSWPPTPTPTKPDVTPPVLFFTPLPDIEARGFGIAGIHVGIGAIILIVIVSVIVGIVCWCCCRKGKRVPRTTTSQNNRLNPSQGLHSIGTGAPRTAGVTPLAAVPAHHAPPNACVQPYPTAVNYPTGGPQPSAGLTSYPVKPPPYDDVHPIQPPSYSQVIREDNHRVEPSAPTIHM